LAILQLVVALNTVQYTILFPSPAYF